MHGAGYRIGRDGPSLTPKAKSSFDVKLAASLGQRSAATGVFNDPPSASREDCGRTAPLALVLRLRSSGGNVTMTGRLSGPQFDASFIRAIEEQGQTAACWQHQGNQIAGAQAVYLLCPCGQGHSLVVPFSNPQGAQPASDNFGMRLRGNPLAPPPRWAMGGASLADLTLTPSVSVGDPECWHGWIQGGDVR